MCQKTVLDAMDLFSNNAGDLMEEVSPYMTQKYYTCISLDAWKVEREA